MIEEELRATFARHETLTPAAGPLLARIEEGYRRRRRVRRSLRISGAAVVAVAVLAVPAFAAGSAHRAPVPATHVPPDPARAGDYLLVGTDGRSADTVLLVHVPADGTVGYVVTLPRDVLVPVPGHGDATLAAAYQTGGFALLTRTVSGLTGVTPTAGALVRFEGLRSVVDALGGLRLCIDEKVVSIHVGHARDGAVKAPFTVNGNHFTPVPGVTPEVYNVGCQRLAGWQVLDYARQRDLLANGDADVGRQRHVRQIMAALFRAVTDQRILVDPVRVQGVLDAAGSAVTVDTGGGDLARLVGVVGRLKELVGLAVPTVLPSDQSGTVRLGPDAPTLFQALRDDDLAGWSSEHPDAVNG